ncbi:OTU domain-containing protein [Microbulbifer sp. EKSA005]|uniref:OTU domain-containing protein n=1 Tax=Microbulbifer sp. EKSA005 TaxID=3243364 RepID=UPI004042BC45
MSGGLSATKNKAGAENANNTTRGGDTAGAANANRRENATAGTLQRQRSGRLLDLMPSMPSMPSVRSLSPNSVTKAKHPERAEVKAIKELHEKQVKFLMGLSEGREPELSFNEMLVEIIKDFPASTNPGGVANRAREIDLALSAYLGVLRNQAKVKNLDRKHDTLYRNMKGIQEIVANNKSLVNFNGGIKDKSVAEVCSLINFGSKNASAGMKDDDKKSKEISDVAQIANFVDKIGGLPQASDRLEDVGEQAIMLLKDVSGENSPTENQVNNAREAVKQRIENLNKLDLALAKLPEFVDKGRSSSTTSKKVGWEDSFRKYWSEFVNRTTIRDVLSYMASGAYEYFTKSESKEEGAQKKVNSIDMRTRALVRTNRGDICPQLLEDIKTDGKWFSDTGDFIPYLLAHAFQVPVSVAMVSQDKQGVQVVTNVEVHNKDCTDNPGITLVHIHGDGDRTNHYEVLDNPESLARYRSSGNVENKVKYDQLETQEIKGDGNCLYRAFAQAFADQSGNRPYNKEDDYKSIRQQLALWVEVNKSTKIVQRVITLLTPSTNS